MTARGPVAASLELARRYVRVRHERARGYPQRLAVPDDKASWDVAWEGYAPPYFVHPRVLENDRRRKPGGWADPEDVRVVAPAGHPWRDEMGRALNPMGRTGLAGRGLLGRWGVNRAVDTVLLAETAGDLQLLAIRRADQGKDGPTAWALPGGMQDDGESVPAALARELEEETHVKLDMSAAGGAVIVAAGPVDDPRSTDHAWIETTAALRVLSADEAGRVRASMKAADDATGVALVTVDVELASRMYASHARLLGAALDALAQRRALPARAAGCLAAALR